MYEALRNDFELVRNSVERNQQKGLYTKIIHIVITLANNTLTFNSKSWDSKKKSNIKETLAKK